MKDNIAIITGASRGIGAATAILLGKSGYTIVVNYLEEQEKAKTVVDTINSQGGKAIAVEGDIGDESKVIHLFNVAEREFGTPNVLINNAAINGHIGPVETLTEDALLKTYKTNVFGPFLCSREAIKRMKSAGISGNIVNVTSEAAKFGGNMMTSYASSKAALSTFTIGLAREVGKDNIRVNAVSPSIINTELHAQSSEERMTALKNSIPLGRIGTPEEVAETIKWIISDKASYLSGSIISISGAR